MIKTDGTITLSDLPIICWRDVVTVVNVSAESDPDFPASNVANPSTALKWKHDATESPESAIEYFRIDVSGAQTINYVAIAGHNFSTAGVAVGLEIATDSSPIGGGGGVITPFVPNDNSPIIFLFTSPDAESPMSASNIEDLRIILVTGTSPAEMAVVYAGEYTVFEQGIQADHTPLPLAEEREIVSGRSENGAFLGRITISSQARSNASFANLSKAWVRAQLMPFLEFAAENPFFYAWSPLTYPEETGFAWLQNNPLPTFDIDGYAAVDFDMAGIVS